MHIFAPNGDYRVYYPSSFACCKLQQFQLGQQASFQLGHIESRDELTNRARAKIFDEL